MAMTVKALRPGHNSPLVGELDTSYAGSGYLTPHISHIVSKWGNDCRDYVTEIYSKNPMD